MKTFNSFKEIEKYYSKNLNTYIFVENGKKLDICFTFDLCVQSNIDAENIDAWNIDAEDIRAEDIKALDIKAEDIKARNVDAWDIKAKNIKAWDIKAEAIDARNIQYYAVCYAYESLACTSIKGERKNSKHFCLDNAIELGGKK